MVKPQLDGADVSLLRRLLRLSFPLAQENPQLFLQVITDLGRSLYVEREISAAHFREMVERELGRPLQGVFTDREIGDLESAIQGDLGLGQFIAGLSQATLLALLAIVTPPEPAGPQDTTEFIHSFTDKGRPELILPKDHVFLKVWALPEEFDWEDRILVLPGEENVFPSWRAGIHTLQSHDLKSAELDLGPRIVDLAGPDERNGPPHLGSRVRVDPAIGGPTGHNCVGFNIRFEQRNEGREIRSELRGTCNAL